MPFRALFFLLFWSLFAGWCWLLFEVGNCSVLNKKKLQPTPRPCLGSKRVCMFWGELSAFSC
uniref:Uncharacterized protein n=1 Tax=Arundo donax TaxID=35708 RepID=A0A0A9GV90_ARUDO